MCKVCNGDKLHYESFDELPQELKDKFKPNSVNKQTKDGFLNFINELNKRGDVLVGDYYNATTKTLINFCCGHEPHPMTQDKYMGGQGCPYCSNRKVLKGFNDLATTHPQLAKEWHPTKNGDLKPTDVTYGSGKMIWWQCEKGHEWKTKINGRTSMGNCCKKCADERKSGENCHWYNPNLTDEERKQNRGHIPNYNEWVNKVKELAHYTCDCCGYVGEKGDRFMRSHHLNNYQDNKELATDLDNGVCLCKHCHDEFHYKYMGSSNTPCTKQDYIDFKKQQLNKI